LYCKKRILALYLCQHRAGNRVAMGVIGKGAALDACLSRLSVLSYNLLAPLYVRPVDERTGSVQAFAAFEWAEPAAQRLDWAVRRPRLRAELQASRADVICLQEVQYEAGADGVFALPDWLRLDGYALHVPPQRDLAEIASRNLRVLRHEVAVGNAVLVRSDRLCVLDDGKRSSNTRVQVVVRGREGGAIAALGPTAVASVHLDATDEAKRVKAFARCVEQASAFGTRELIVCGDMNTECLPGSCVGAFAAAAAQPSPEDIARECASALRLGGGEGGGGEGGGGDGGGGEGGGGEGGGGEGGGGGGMPTAAQLSAWEELRAVWRRECAGPRGGAR